MLTCVHGAGYGAPTGKPRTCIRLDRVAIAPAGSWSGSGGPETTSLPDFSATSRSVLPPGGSRNSAARGSIALYRRSLRTVTFRARSTSSDANRTK